MSTSTLTISRAERDIILEELNNWLPGTQFADEVPFGTREEAADSIRKLRLGFAMYDELGWSEDDPRESFTVTLTAEFMERLVEFGTEAAERAVHDREHRARALSGDRDSWFVGCSTLDEAVAQYDRMIERDDNERRVCDELLARIQQQGLDAAQAQREWSAAWQQIADASERALAGLHPLHPRRDELADLAADARLAGEQSPATAVKA